MGTTNGARPAGAAPSLQHGPSARQRSRRIASVLVAALVIATVVPIVYVYGPAVVRPSHSIPIDHIVILDMENRAYDNLFGTYCNATGPNCPNAANGIPPGTCVPYDPTNLSKGCIRPFQYAPNRLQLPDLPHTWGATIGSINGGAMNGFYPAEGNTPEPLGYYNGTTVPTYWDLAEEFGLGDDFFSSALSYSLPNHWYLMAGQTPGPQISFNNTFAGGTPAEHNYLNLANRTETVQDLLNYTPGVSWKYYDWALPSYEAAINAPPGTGVPSAYAYWNPLAARHESYTQWYVAHFVARSQFFQDASAGQLPAISWLIPDFTFSDHPPANLTHGQSYVASVVDAVMSSPNWNSTALFVTWDDYGGFYDHVAPPSLDALGLSIRVPMIVVSPYTPKGLVVHSLGYFESLLHFVEWRFGLGCITPRDCNAPLPLGFFDFNMTPRAPMLFPTSTKNATYPYVPPAAAAGRTVFADYAAIDPAGWNTGPPPSDLTYTEVD